MTAYDKAIGHQHHYTAQEMRSLLESGGFGGVRVLLWGAPFHTLYRMMVGLASARLKGTEKPGDYSAAYCFLSVIFDKLFYLNVTGCGRQIFGWGYKNADRD